MTQAQVGTTRSAADQRPQSVDRALRALHQRADDRPRRHGRERRAALDQGRSRLLAVEPRLGRERLPDHVRRPAAARRAAGRSDRPPDDPPLRPGRLRHRLGALRPLAERGDADRRAAPPGHRRRDDLGRRPGHDRDDVPGAAGPGQGGGGLRLRRLGGRRGRPADRRCRDPDDQLALDLLHQCPDRPLHGDLRPPPAREGQGHRLRPGRGHRSGPS